MAAVMYGAAVVANITWLYFNGFAHDLTCLQMSVGLISLGLLAKEIGS